MATAPSMNPGRSPVTNSSLGSIKVVGITGKRPKTESDIRAYEKRVAKRRAKKKR